MVSSNIVGYQKINLVAGYNMVAAQFGIVGENSLERGIATIGTLDDQMPGYDSEWTYDTTMLVWDPSTTMYATYGWAGTSPETVDDMPELNNQWLDANTEETDDTIQMTSGVWIKTTRTGTFTVSGEVPSGNTVTLPLVAGYNMVANPFPAEVPISSFGMLDSTMAGYDSEWTYATTMLVWDAATEMYATYGWAGTSPETVDDMPELNNQWLDANTEPTTDTIPAGASVWIQAATAGNITFTSPVAE